ncbi:hypothetical protein ACIBF5_20790, partial [Micromonospora sp. NPDC050417]|uniref:hypothetical protein n=1 Tax=Micromonospora sp. NPDC050417 TaxID=3364280 RepID=UPI00378B4085
MSTPLRRTAAGLAAVLAFTAAGTPPASAAPPPGAAPTAPTSPTDATSKVTLITGDVVEVSAAGAGRFAASVRPGPGREQVTFHTVEVDGGLRVL